MLPGRAFHHVAVRGMKELMKAQLHTCKIYGEKAMIGPSKVQIGLSLAELTKSTSVSTHGQGIME